MNFSPTMLQKLFFWLLCLLLPLALVPIGLAVKAVRDAGAAESWQKVPAQIVSSAAVSKCTKGCVHLVNIVYRYKIAQTAYAGSRIYFGDENLSSKAEAEKMAHTYAPGTSLMVYVNPLEPGESSMFVGRIGERTWVASLATIAVYLLAWLTYLAVTFLIRSGMGNSAQVRRP